ncbi:Hypothetical predicted protein [Mytilus galloprovincialis]|uniref:Uncharacterized protein n=1 Tax=Mytilus galloprovincialis TaxID=29158 RepID=A0A8B6F821_MYTGA|nr:Hypothetical predicted protein [Mytilus galloprovincialis]
MRARPSSVGVSSQYYNSKEFFAGAQIEKPSYTLQSGKEVTIRIKSTVPVACVEGHGHKTCGINIELFSLKDQFQGRPANCNDSLPDEEIKMSKSACGLVFDGSNWDEYHSFKLQTLSDQALRKSYKCAAKLIAKSNIDTLWLNYQLPEVYVSNLKKLS